jgi:uncharacterized protein YyaL (SSP411 family)
LNRLASETSPYLLQHKSNPVDWRPWSEEAFELARSEEKLVLVSIGYSACHWCHVMEHESFEDEEIAKFMNDHFINIKVDREERPDVDQIYMNAVQIMTQQGGWPLNCFLLPNKKPIYGGTYFPMDQWLSVLKRLVELQQNEQPKLKEYAEKLAQGIVDSDFIEIKPPHEFKLEDLDKGVTQWMHHFDWKYGGTGQAPKFPLPTNYLFLQAYGQLKKDPQVLNFVDLTLEKMARGGIYDQLGGGFSRYSVDAHWKVPHFEKMLYDNAQLLSLYAKAYWRTGSKEYHQVITETIGFLKEELLADSEGFYSALDADSEGVEGKYYVWNEKEFKTILGSDFLIAKDYFNLNDQGLWEDGNYILLRTNFEESDQLTNIKAKLKKARIPRIMPGLDDKIISSWNGLTIVGLVDSYLATGQHEYLELAKSCASFIEAQVLTPIGKLFHTHQQGVPKIDGFLEDYSFITAGFISLFEASSDEHYIHMANLIAQYAIENFFSSENGMFNFTDKNGEQLIANKQEVTDNVIPASNSEMAKCLFKLGNYFGNPSYSSMAKQMLSNMWDKFPKYPSGYTNWGMLGLELIDQHVEVVVSGINPELTSAKLRSMVPFNVTILNCSKQSELSIFKGRFQTDETTIFVCKNGACAAPVSTINEAISLIE